MLSYFNYLFSSQKNFSKSLKKILGFYPRKLKYYQKAFIHKSASNIRKDGRYENNERLEYLGDAVLDAIISDYFFYKFPDENEGFLTQMRSKIVNGAQLNELARRMGIRELLISNINQSSSKKHIYEDAFEAFIGAIFIDRGYTRTKKFVIEKVIKKYIDLEKLESVDTNYKSQLIEWAQKYKKEVEFYTDLEAVNSKYFISYVRVENKNLGSGIGISKKVAEQKAAKATLEMVSDS